MKLYDQMGNWGVLISSTDLEGLACSVVTEEDDFTIEIEFTNEILSVEVTAIHESSVLDVSVYYGASLNPIKYRILAKELASFIATLKADGKHS